MYQDAVSRKVRDPWGLQTSLLAFSIVPESHPRALHDSRNELQHTHCLECQMGGVRSFSVQVDTHRARRDLDDSYRRVMDLLTEQERMGMDCRIGCVSDGRLNHRHGRKARAKIDARDSSLVIR